MFDEAVLHLPTGCLSSNNAICKVKDWIVNSFTWEIFLHVLALFPMVYCDTSLRHSCPASEAIDALLYYRFFGVPPGLSQPAEILSQTSVFRQIQLVLLVSDCFPLVGPDGFPSWGRPKMGLTLPWKQRLEHAPCFLRSECIFTNAPTAAPQTNCAWYTTVERRSNGRKIQRCKLRLVW